MVSIPAGGRAAYVAKLSVRGKRVQSQEVDLPDVRSLPDQRKRRPMLHKVCMGRATVKETDIGVVVSSTSVRRVRLSPSDAELR